MTSIDIEEALDSIDPEKCYRLTLPPTLPMKDEFEIIREPDAFHRLWKEKQDRLIDYKAYDHERTRGIIYVIEGEDGESKRLKLSYWDNHSLEIERRRSIQKDGMYDMKYLFRESAYRDGHRILIRGNGYEEFGSAEMCCDCPVEKDPDEDEAWDKSVLRGEQFLSHAGEVLTDEQKRWFLRHL